MFVPLDSPRCHHKAPHTHGDTWLQNMSVLHTECWIDIELYLHHLKTTGMRDKRAVLRCQALQGFHRLHVRESQSDHKPPNEGSWLKWHSDVRRKTCLLAYANTHQRHNHQDVCRVCRLRCVECMQRREEQKAARNGRSRLYGGLFHCGGVGLFA
jgi:hypothetical protein